MNRENSSVIIIEAGKSEKNYWRDLWLYRELFYFLAWRDILVRYKQTVFGVAWAVIRPVLTMIVFTIIFGKIAKLPSNGIPYPVLVFSAMLPWQFFAGCFSDAGNSLINNSSMISKVYFPRLIIPSSSIVVNLVDFFISFLILILLMIWYDFYPTWRLIFLPFFIFLAIATAFGASLLIASLNVRYRDFRYIIPFVVQFGLYISPVGFSSSIVPADWRLLYSVNPMVGVIDGFRWAILGNSSELYLPGFVFSLFFVSVLIFIGLHYFRKTERTFADVI